MIKKKKVVTRISKKKRENMVTLISWHQPSGQPW